MELGLKGKTVFLTGGCGGIGSVIKREYEEEGATVIAPLPDELDLSTPNGVEEYLKKGTCPPIDIFVHCAGMNDLAGIEEVTEENLQRTFSVNYFSAVRLLHHFATHMKEQRFGRIVFISTIYAIVSRERRIPYSSSKHALNGLMKSMALELGEYNILINQVAPGYVMTPMTTKNLSKEELDFLIEKTLPTKRLQTPEDIADAVLFFGSPRNRSINGQLLAVDGGFTCK